ncbi:RanBP2-type domain-containing protein [Plasmodiophora brassicae]
MAPGAERVAAAPVRGSHLPDRGCVWTPTHRGWHQGARRRRGTMSDADITSILFGASPDPDDVRRWADEGFVFSAAVPWGLRQRQGGPCAVLAPVQAFLIAELLAVSSVFDATPEQCQEALVGALALILWHARPSTTSPAFLGATAHASLDTLRDTIRRSDLQQPGAIVEFVKSLLRTRTIDGVKTDLNYDTEPLVSRFGHGSQELVNLCLFGRAVSHLFDGRRQLAPDVEVCGVPSRCRIGLLSQMEVLQYTKVGNFLRCPLLPIWIVASATHYTVLFSTDPTVAHLSDADVAEHVAHAEFAAFDTTDSNFIAGDDLGPLLHRLHRDDLARDLDRVRGLVDPDGLGIVLWSSLWGVLQATLVGDDASEPWQCAACTFVNANEPDQCEICMTPRPPRAAAAGAADGNGAQQGSGSARAPDQFVLFHYNGMENHSGATATCCQVGVTVMDAEGIPQGQSAERGLREVIQTRWPDAIVDFEQGVEPRIT